MSGNIQANPPTSMKSADPVFKLFCDMFGCPWTRLGITGVRLAYKSFIMRYLQKFDRLN
jgi:hypothetical protein